MDQIKPLIRRIILREVAILQQRSLECAIAEALQIAGVAVDILLLIDGNDDTFIQHLLLDFCIQFAALCRVRLHSSSINQGIHLRIAVSEDVVGVIGVEESVRIVNISGILLHKVDSTTGEGIYGVTFLLYDDTNTPIGQYTSDDRGYVYIEDLASGRYYLRELENEGYIVDTEKKTVYLRSGETTEITWENTPVTGQIQITKTSEDHNSINGWPAGTPIPNTEFEIYNARTGKLVDTIRTDKNGVAVSKPLPLARYEVIESKAADFYGLDKTPIEVEIEYAGQIVKAAMTNKSLYTNVSIKKTGYVEVMPGQTLRYDFTDIANNSTTALESFYWRERALFLDNLRRNTQ